MVRQNRIPNTDVAGDTLVEASVGEDAKRRGEMLFAVQSFFLEGVEFRIGPDFELLARHRLAESTDCSVILGRGVIDV